MPIPCRSPSARPDHLRRSNRHGTVPKTRSMNMDHDLHDEPTRPAHHGQRPFKSHETCLRHPCGQAGQPKALRLRDRHDTRTSLRNPAPCHPACLLFTITSEQDNGGRKARTIANSVSHLRMFRSTPRTWWSQTGSNRRPQACKASALPTELWPHSVTSPNPEGIGWPEWTRTTDLTLIRRVL